MNYKEFNKIQRGGCKQALIKANSKVETLKNNGLSEEEAINKVLVEGYN